MSVEKVLRKKIQEKKEIKYQSIKKYMKKIYKRSEEDLERQKEKIKKSKNWKQKKDHHRSEYWVAQEIFNNKKIIKFLDYTHLKKRQHKNK